MPLRDLSSGAAPRPLLRLRGISVFPKAIFGQAIYRAFSGVPVHPRNRHLQKPGDFMHRQELRAVFISVVQHCGLLLLNAARTKHSGVLSVPDLIVVPCPTSSAADSSENPRVNRKVNDGVNCVFHAPFTLGGNRLRWDRCRVCKEKAVAAGGMRLLRWPLGSHAPPRLVHKAPTW